MHSYSSNPVLKQLHSRSVVLTCVGGPDRILAHKRTVWCGVVWRAKPVHRVTILESGTSLNYYLPTFFPPFVLLESITCFVFSCIFFFEKERWLGTLTDTPLEEVC